MESQEVEDEELLEQIGQMPQAALEQLLGELGPALPPYVPEEETRVEFARRLVDYFGKGHSRFVLSREVKKVLGVGPFDRYQAFLSYSAKDRSRADQIAGALVSKGHRVWSREKDLGPGGSLTEVIGRAMRQSDAFVLLLSPGAIASRNVLFELGLWVGIHGMWRVLPVLLSPCTVPSDLQGIEVLDLRDAEPSPRRLSQALEGLLSRP